jgi:hypothetical protein
MSANPATEHGNTRQSLLDWLAAYRTSVGESGEICSLVLGELLGGTLVRKEGQVQLLQLLKILQGLSPDPRTVTCAMLWVAFQNGDDLEAWDERLPGGVRQQLDELLRLLETRAAVTRHALGFQGPSTGIQVLGESQQHQLPRTWIPGPVNWRTRPY